MGWEKYKFYYPFPDYKLPEVIYTEEYLPGREDINLLPIFFYLCNSNFDIRGTYQGLRDNAQFGFFSNSFFNSLTIISLFSADKNKSVLSICIL